MHNKQSFGHISSSLLVKATTSRALGTSVVAFTRSASKYDMNIANSEPRIDYL
jgi:hypothetical protein